MIAEINGTINPATDDYLKSALHKAEERQAKLFILKLNTPGGLLSSMQSMVETLLQAKVPTVVYVSPQGGSASSAGVFVTMAAHFAVMAPGTTIGAAHPVMGGGADIGADMRDKLENYAVSLSRAIAEQRGRNAKWAEDAVRESVSITDREAVTEKVVDFSAADLAKLLGELEGKSVTIGGTSVTLEGLLAAPQETIEMSLKQQVANFLSDPNVVMLLGLGAMAGIGIELLHPGAILPGVVGVVCLLLSLIAAQVIPINAGGLCLLLLSFVFFGAELFVPSFGVLGIAGSLCLILGSLYFVDADKVWSESGFTIARGVIVTLLATVGLFVLFISSVVLRGGKEKAKTGKEGLEGQLGVVFSEFKQDSNGTYSGRVRVRGEIWRARASDASAELRVGDNVSIEKVEEGLLLLVKKQ